MEYYTITFADLDVSFIDASYTIKQIEVLENDSKAPIPLFTADKLRFTLPWTNLVAGNFVCTMDLDSAALNFVRGPSPEFSQTGVQSELIRLLRKLSPYPVDKFQANGEISFRDYHQNPRVEMIVTNVRISGGNLRNLAQDETLLPGKIIGKGNIGGGSIALRMKVNPLQDEPIFEMETVLESIDLSTVADIMKSDHEVHVDKGLLRLTAHTTTKENIIATDVTRSFSNLQASHWKKSSDADVKVENEENTKSKKPKFIVTSWTASKPTSKGNQHIEGEILNYKGNLLSLTGETLLGIFNNAVIEPIEKSVRRPAVYVEEKAKVTKAGKKEKKNFLQKLFKKKEEKDEGEETVTASDR
jgi:hypothetical protein